ncbi:tRNA pseudouridine(55) synthase TruB [Cyanobacterium stanieri LEGE 03274]|uniref:tRNA pseudouridine synthase B n=1 Tax=Cyanobacterium stanieri LEGE 03274 TaxID=1828756 RepID=A0ABR9V0Q2_9CHRO|nr:tRNA pseudouridine(55) synthase TruB [Cyanobacterium stanieri]MBE9221154.1 tRNA pseudouridine(55) synthase TruB [Cyanobacterium stanieri LEGE 03274]
MMGFINLHKPKGFSSHDCVAKVRRILHTKKVGHGGTLDPLATGVLPMAVGKATRLLQFLPTKKAYRARIRFGVVTTTDDLEGEIIRQDKCPDLKLENVANFIPHFVGNIVQIPPIYSAIKQGGKKLYELARQGKDVEIIPRNVEIFEINIINWDSGDYPELDVEIVCGAGTYIRAIARDLGERVGTGATLAKLERTLSCNLEIKNSVTLEVLEKEKKDDKLFLIKPDLLLENLPTINLNDNESMRWQQGQKLKFNQENNHDYYRTYNHEQKFLGISTIKQGEEGLIIKPKIVIINPNET